MTPVYEFVNSSLLLSEVAQPRYVVPLNWARSVVVGLSLFVAVPGNVFMLVAIVTSRQIRRSLRNVLLVHLSVSSLLLSMLILPLSIISAARASTIRGISCRAMGFITTSLTLVVLWTITSICLEKYRSISRPLHHKTTASKGKISMVFVSVWTSAFTLAGLPMYFGRMYTYDSTSHSCRFIYYSSDPIIRWISGALVTATFLGPLVILTICHIRIYFIAKSHRKSITGILQLVSRNVQAPIMQHRRASQPHFPLGRRKAIHTTSYIMGAFITCYLPLTILNLCEIISQSPQSPVFAIISATAFQVSPAINAWVYGLKNRNLRGALIDLYNRKAANYAQRLTLPPKHQRKKDYLNGTKNGHQEIKCETTHSAVASPVTPLIYETIL